MLFCLVGKSASLQSRWCSVKYDKYGLDNIDVRVIMISKQDHHDLWPFAVDITARGQTVGKKESEDWNPAKKIKQPKSALPFPQPWRKKIVPNVRSCAANIGDFYQACDWKSLWSRDSLFFLQGLLSAAAILNIEKDWGRGKESWATYLLAVSVSFPQWLGLRARFQALAIRTFINAKGLRKRQARHPVRISISVVRIQLVDSLFPFSCVWFNYTLSALTTSIELCQLNHCLLSLGSLRFAVYDLSSSDSQAGKHCNFWSAGVCLPKRKGNRLIAG